MTARPSPTHLALAARLADADGREVVVTYANGVSFTVRPKGAMVAPPEQAEPEAELDRWRRKRGKDGAERHL